MKALKSIFVLFVILITPSFNAQDIHFSQYSASLLNLSPAYTGFFDGDYRFGAIYRSQWYTVPVSYSSFSFNGETRFQPNFNSLNQMGIGILFNSDKAGAANYGSNQLYANLSYLFFLKPDSSLILSLGGSAGWCSVGFDNTKATYDQQFNGFEYEKGLATGEAFNRTRSNYLDVGSGLALQYITKKKTPHKLCSWASSHE